MLSFQSIDFGTFEMYSVVNAGFRTRPSAIGLPQTLRGAGFYTLIQGFAGPLQQLRLNLSLDGGPLEFFDSGLLNGGVLYPEVHIPVSQNGLVCFDKLIDLHAIPITTALRPATTLPALSAQGR